MEPAPHWPLRASQVTALLRESLGADLVALYLYGSHVDGGLKPASDLDLLAVVRRPLTEPERAGIASALLRLSSPPGDPSHRALEVTLVVLPAIDPWQHPAMRELQFGEWLRPALLAGAVLRPEVDPDLALLIVQAREKGVALFGPPPESLLPEVPRDDVRSAILSLMPEVAKNLAGEEKHALLTLARMWVTLQTGEIVPKDVAASRIGSLLPATHRPTLERALAVYLGTADDDWREWQDRVAGCVRYMVDAMREWTGPE